jgi:hypothetical protein
MADKGPRKYYFPCNVYQRLTKALERCKCPGKFIKRCHNQADKGLRKAKKKRKAETPNNPSEARLSCSCGKASSRQEGL